MGLIGGIGQWRLRWRLALLLTVVGSLTVGSILADQRIEYQAIPGLQIGILASAALIGIAIGWGFLQRAAATVERLTLVLLFQYQLRPAVILELTIPPAVPAKAPSLVSSQS